MTINAEALRVTEIEEFLVDVLRRAHQTAEAADAPDEERAVLRVAHLFAQDLSASEPAFDRLRFIEAVMQTDDVHERGLTT